MFTAPQHLSTQFPGFTEQQYSQHIIFQQVDYWIICVVSFPPVIRYLLDSKPTSSMQSGRRSTFICLLVSASYCITLIETCSCISALRPFLCMSQRATSCAFNQHHISFRNCARFLTRRARTRCSSFAALITAVRIYMWTGGHAYRRSNVSSSRKP